MIRLENLDQRLRQAGGDRTATNCEQRLRNAARVGVGPDGGSRIPRKAQNLRRRPARLRFDWHSLCPMDLRPPTSCAPSARAPTSAYLYAKLPDTMWEDAFATLVATSLVSAYLVRGRVYLSPAISASVVRAWLDKNDACRTATRPGKRRSCSCWRREGTRRKRRRCSGSAPRPSNPTATGSRASWTSTTWRGWSATPFGASSPSPDAGSVRTTRPLGGEQPARTGAPGPRATC